MECKPTEIFEKGIKFYKSKEYFIAMGLLCKFRSNLYIIEASSDLRETAYIYLGKIYYKLVKNKLSRYKPEEISNYIFNLEDLEKAGKKIDKNDPVI